jgi:acyl transferase domain-containing protein/NADPH:quinone reductase-like Zn-dependent oxidoreductase/ubiquinone/menaquinone biosynthesis C-methylase UbiE/NADP-dependent 3-hydroxy acid dehydrogenase YdfG/acyl carrier protein
MAIESSAGTIRLAAESDEPGTARHQPIAVIGIGCRFPGGVADTDSFWQLLRDGVDATREVPPDRWNKKTFYHPELATPGRSHSCKGGFLDSIDLFDAGFFGISPREAACMDPQQRLLLELAFEAMEDAGVRLEALAQSPTGVYVGLSGQDYALLQHNETDLTRIDAHTSTGLAMSIAANRISYCLDLHGPSLALDTACSSSLVAVHLACQGLWSSDCDAALAGGVHILIKPEPWIGFSRMSMLSPTGSCKAFDAAADGFARSEGGAIIALKRYADAVHDGDRIHALIRGTAVNQDGRTSSMPIPNEEAQVALIRRAALEAGVAPQDVQYVEAHGTGTAVGDPIEARALSRVYCDRRAQERSCFVGSVKSNIGHLEPAAGIAGLVKTVLALKHRQIPPNPNFRVPNPDIPFDRLKLRVPTQLAAWPQPDRTLLAGVNSFGFGGTNAHAILQQPPRVAHPGDGADGSPRTGAAAQRKAGETPLGRPRLFVFSARGKDALRAYVEACRIGPLAAAESDSELDDFAWSSAVRRNHHDTRLCVTAETGKQLSELLAAYAAGESRAGIATGRIAEKSPHVAFVFSGQGPQWWGMGRELLAREPVFRDAVAECDAYLRTIAPWSLAEELTREEASSRMNDPAIAQPAIFAVQFALARLWSRWGIEPAAVVGHSVGEVAAACLAGALTLPQALDIIYHRGRCMDFDASHGRMLAVGLSPQEAEKLLDGFGERVSLAAINGPQSVTLSGDGDALEKIAKDLEGRKIFHSFLKVDRAFHSARLDAIREELVAALAGVQGSAARIPLYSTVTGARCTGEELDAEYWWRNARHTVQFAGAAEAMIEADHDLFIEVSPHPVLSHSVVEIAASSSRPVQVLPSLRRGEPELRTMLNSLGRLYSHGVMPDWTALLPAGRFVPWPRYPWQRERHWYESQESVQRRAGPAPHPLLGKKTSRSTWEQQIHLKQLRYLADHRVRDHVVLPATAFLEIAAAAVGESHRSDHILLEDVEFQRLCFLSEDEGLMLHLAVEANESDFTVCSRPKDDDRWIPLARGKMRTYGDRAHSPADLESVRRRCRTYVAKDDCYRALDQLGLQYGPAFRGIDGMWIGSGEALGRFAAPEDLARLDGSPEDYHIQPAVLDSCFQVILGTLPHRGKYLGHAGGVFLPVGMRRLQVFAPLRRSGWSHVRLVQHDDSSLTADIDVIDNDGTRMIEVKGLQCRLVEARTSHLHRTDDLVYQYGWVRHSLSGREQTEKTPEAAFSPRSFMRSTSAQTREYIVRHRILEQYRTFDTDMARLCGMFVRQAFQDLGIEWRAGTQFSVAELRQRGVHPRYERVVHRYCDMMCDDGLLRRLEDGFEICVSPLTDLDILWNECLGRNPAYYAEFVLVRGCGSRLAEMLRGEVDPLQVLFAHGSLAIPDQLYQDSPNVRHYNRLVAWAVAEFAERFHDERDIRVLEIGAGTGGLTSYVLPELPPGRSKYVFTDVSGHFLLHAQEKFRHCDDIEYRKLDIEADPVEQGLGANEYDLVLASQVLHATKDLRASLKNVRRLLRPGGLLVVLEAVRPVRWVDLSFGLTEAWWSFSDHDLRPDYPLLTLPQWRGLLEQQGFEEVTELSGLDDDTATSAMLVAVTPRWQPEAAAAEASVSPETAVPWILFADRNGVAHRLRDELVARAQRCIMVQPGESYGGAGPGNMELCVGNREHLARLFQGAGGRCRGVVHLRNLDFPPARNMTTSHLDEALVAGCVDVVHLVQTLGEAFLQDPPQLWIVTSGVHTVVAGDTAAGVAQSAAWGLGRVIANEAPALRTTLVDLSTDPGAEELDLLCAELLRPQEDANEDEVALRGVNRYVHRVQHVRDRLHCPDFDRRLLAGRQPYRVETSRSGALQTLALFGVDRAKPGPDEIEIHVAASGLNFSDVMKVLGLYPDLPPGPLTLGLECSGVVSAVGSNVTAFKVGDEVIAAANASLASHVLTPAPFAARKPPHMSFEEASTLPVAFLTAHYALHHVARLRRGEKVLLHSATGGVGLAAIQIARRLGAEIFATAGTAEKREFLRYMGVDHVWDSRSLAFADEIVEVTGGRGVDVVLNSLSGDALVKSLDVLAPYGRFVEIGKRDIYADTRIGLKPFRKQISMGAIDMVALPPEFIYSLFEELMREAREGTLTPLPHRIFSIANTAAAFRYMAQSKHIGKIVIAAVGENVRVRPPRQITTRFSADATYLITGGLGGFGLLIAEWMVAHGARHLVLVGRRAVPSAEQQVVIDQMRAAGADLVIKPADVSRPEDVQSVIAAIAESLPPLRGVIHAAMVLNDCLLVNMTEERMREVWAPKVRGAWILHRATLNTPLDFFVMFSSLACVLGSPGQANYAAANALLDGLAEYRRACGLPASTIAWGFLGDVGWLARHEGIAERVQAQGIHQFSPRQALALLGQFIVQKPVSAAVLNMDWRRWSEAAGRSLPPKFAHLAQSAGQEGDDARVLAAAVRAELMAANAERRAVLLQDILLQRVARVLGTSPDKINPDQPLTELGLDSLMSIEIKNWIETELQLKLSTVEVMKGPTIVRLVKVLLEQLATGPARATAAVSAAPAAASAAERVAAREREKVLSLVDELSDQEIEILVDSVAPHKVPQPATAQKGNP